LTCQLATAIVASVGDGAVDSGTLRSAVADPAGASGAARRQAILELLRSAGGPLTGEALAERLGVSRQAIVHDMAILRAAGQPIVATVRGYLLATPRGQAVRAVVAVRHSPGETADELMALVDQGARVVDVVVDHPLYGELRGELQLSSPADVRAWLEATQRSGAHLLSELTDGVHLHTIEAPSEAVLARAREALAARGFLLQDQTPADR
jgi:hypothetical protein